MARTRTPWFHAGTGYWCSKIGGKRVYLSRDLAKAKQKLARLLAGEKPRGFAAWLEAPFTSLADEFLADVQARRSAGTYADYSDSLARAFKYLSDRLSVGDFRHLHLLKVEQELVKAGLGPTSVCKTLHAVMRVFNWAVETKLLDASPVAGYKRPAPRERSRIVTPEEFRAMLRESDAAFRRFLLALRLTGCRPGELRKLLWEHVDLDAGVWILPEHKTVTRQKKPRPRIVALTGPMVKLVRWMQICKVNFTNHVFLNSRGKPWSNTAVVSRLRRLRERAGIEPKAGEQVVLYSMRHSYATSAVGKLTSLEIGELLGHTSERTVKRYTHISPDRLRDMARKAAGGV